MKTVTYDEFCRAKRQANDELRKLSNALFNEESSSNVELESNFAYEMETTGIKMCINWYAIGKVDVEKALAMTTLLHKAVELASTFVYNGYIIKD